VRDIIEFVRNRNINALRKFWRDRQVGGILSPREYRQYFKFTFVRNPWARVFSWYQNVMRDRLHRNTLGIPDACSLSEFVHLNAEQWALRPQLHWIKDRSGKIALDFIGRYESLEDDFKIVCQRLGIVDSKLPKMLTSEDQEYTAYYDQDSRELIARRYAPEIEIFGFYYGEYPCNFRAS
jgi:hypothetical protein